MATKDSPKKLLNIIIPAYNEAKRLPTTLRALAAYLGTLNTLDTSIDTDHDGIQDQFDVEVFIVNDGSKDETNLVSRQLLESFKLKGGVLGYHHNQGKGWAVRTGMLESRSADLYFLADADLASPWSVLGEFLEALGDKKAHVVIGSRTNERQVKVSLPRKIFAHLSNLVIRLLLGLRYPDTQCGYKLFTPAALKAFKMQKIKRWGFDFEILYLLSRLGLKTVPLEITWSSKEGSKVSASSYFFTLLELFKVRFNKYKVK